MKFTQPLKGRHRLIRRKGPLADSAEPSGSPTPSQNLIYHTSQPPPLGDGHMHLAVLPKEQSSMTTDSNSTVTMTLTLHEGRITRSISFDCTDSDSWTTESRERLRYRIYRAIDRWLNLSRRSPNVAPSKAKRNSKI